MFELLGKLIQGSLSPKTPSNWNWWTPWLISHEVEKCNLLLSSSPRDTFWEIWEINQGVPQFQFDGHLELDDPLINFNDLMDGRVMGEVLCPICIYLYDCYRQPNKLSLLPPLSLSFSFLSLSLSLLVLFVAFFSPMSTAEILQLFAKLIKGSPSPKLPSNWTGGPPN